MRESIHKYFQVGTIVWMSYPNRGVLDAIKTIASDDFFDAIEVTQNKDPESKIKEKALLEQSHLKVCYGAQPRLLGPKLNPNAIDEAERAKAEATLIEAIDEAEYFGAKGIAFLAGKWEEATKDQAYAQLLKTTNNLCAYAATKNMNVELEVFDFDVDKAALIGPAPLAAKFAGDVRDHIREQPPGHHNLPPVHHTLPHRKRCCCQGSRRLWRSPPALRFPRRNKRHRPAP